MSERRYTPKVIHAWGADGNLCGFSREGSWVEKYLDDEVARTLPPCPECLSEIIRRGWEVPTIWKDARVDVEWVQPSTKPNLLHMATTFPPEPLVVEQSGGILQSSEQMSLREWSK
tara:strand:- start:516 stop:863 length:348 start_codon:yes stop_codon:yes gene_type:complete